MDNKRIKKVIDDLFAGQYGADHEFEAKYDVWQKNEILSGLLNQWHILNDAERKDIIEALKGHIGYYWCNFEPITEALVKYMDLPEVVKVSEEFFEKGFFSLALLRSIDIKKYYPEKWITLIEEKVRNKSFKETYFETDLDKLYEEVDNELKRFKPNEKKPQSER